ncbi:MAG: Mut7-C RNAse domain-containing protein [Casimicrobiaceae bacterium]
MRFLCDEMLGRLARYLRAAGYDTDLACDGAPDRDLLVRAESESRRFLTCDRRIAEHRRARETALILTWAPLDCLAQELYRALGVDWLHAPFTRCLVDNTPLTAVPPAATARMPRDVAAEDARHCPQCGRVYWAGSHHGRMKSRLAAWAAGIFEDVGASDVRTL